MPERHLDLSPEHALMIDSVLVPARHLLNGVTILRQDTGEAVDYLHIELSDHDILLAEGLPAETFVDRDSRHAFDNAAEFTQLFGAAADRRKFCAPRVEDGEILADIWQRLACLAGLAADDWRHPTSEGRLTGNFEAASPDEVRGWAQDESNPERPVRLHILAEGVVIGTAVANLYRRDLEAAQLGSGHHAFRVPMPDLTGPMIGRIEVRRATDGAVLPGAPVLFEAPFLARSAAVV